MKKLSAIGLFLMAVATTPVHAAPSHFEQVSASAAKGDPKSQTALGNMYHDGFGVERDINKALEWYRKAADQNYPDGLYQLGHEYATGHGVTKDNGKAIELFTKAAAQGHSKAEYRLYEYYISGVGVTQDRAKAHEMLARSAKGGYDKGQLGYGRLLLESGDTTNALAYFEKAAEHGSGDVAADAAFRASLIYVQAKDFTKAAPYARKGAQRNANAKILYSGMLLDGLGVPKDMEKGRGLLIEAAEEGSPDAMYLLADLLLRGHFRMPNTELVAGFSGTDPDEIALQDAIKWLEKAAEKGHAMAKQTLQKLSQ